MSNASTTINHVASVPHRGDSTKYCCLIVPVRYISIILATLALLLSTIYGIVGILVLQRLNAHLTDLHRMAIYFHIFVHFSFGLISVLGFYAILLKRPGATSFYIAIVIGQLLFSIGSGAICLFLLFKPSRLQDLSSNQCISMFSDIFTRNLCQRTQLTRGLAVASLIVIWLVEIATFIVGNRFLSQLREESMHLEMLDPKYERDGFDC
ncbi:hypothetical protein BDZ94DRAFT_1159102 [Collybia nuda]|uniref:Uncharacterized protein n=1 Tax=Collybia nuda TaxID=64659 RepID=A0A9P6CH96_9AGAR|nr:hypothetical protein BDZ94DRAFT_1159102 [Collybia nuda]